MLGDFDMYFIHIQSHQRSLLLRCHDDCLTAADVLSTTDVAQNFKNFTCQNLSWT